MRLLISVKEAVRLLQRNRTILHAVLSVGVDDRVNESTKCVSQTDNPLLTGEGWLRQ